MPARMGAGTADSPTEQGYLSAHWPRLIRELKHLIQFPSVSSVSTSAAAMRSCAEWLRAHLVLLGAGGARLVPGGRHPAVFGRIEGPPGAPRVLIYGHYDVQPADPLSDWKFPPFKPFIRNGMIFGRGASDDKGQLFAHFKAVEMLRALHGRLPVTVLFLIDGEEEIGSPGLPRLLHQLGAELESDVAVISDSPVLSEQRPSLVHALRGDLYLDVEVRGRSGDLHSGNFGGSVNNTLEALVLALSKLHDANGRVAVPGFYDHVVEVPLRERQYMFRMGPAAREIQRYSGGATLAGEAGFTAYERSTIRPSIELAGVHGGYQGPGVKGVIPSHAYAKLDIRTVPHQRPRALERNLQQYLAQLLPPGVKLRIRRRMSVPPVLINRNSAVMRVAAAAYAHGFGREPAFVRLGGSIPIVSTLTDQLQIPTLLMGFALPEDGSHAANEHFSLAMLRKGILTSAALLRGIGRS
jgi:acetylornithine deacetylase/succinyl-diaminopimelate desuccinylase-like protein